MLWTAGLDGSKTDPGDWMCTVWLHEGKLCGEYRFRSHRELGFTGKDECSRYVLTPHEDTPANREVLYGAVRGMLKLPGFVDARETPINGGHGALRAALLDLPNWKVNMRTMEKGEQPCLPKRRT